ncbi:LpqB family beta-propeller domain-containing protein [Agrococcus sp. SL85]|uniref:LpqB family beta-propeller domain-containing protein n=1 Tax=Agrococcus sp. SL85 TaxID=2995141 RepID=UPI00226CA039|nr:LpqB family beta-propeller domain-containing protein [Agrococcus sp. SL85]WAC67411.1 LpqB family beta-propeller domain-containing protein [Agrococcus sp. SL85]
MPRSTGRRPPSRCRSRRCSSRATAACSRSRSSCSSRSAASACGRCGSRSWASTASSSRATTRPRSTRATSTSGRSCSRARACARSERARRRSTTSVPCSRASGPRASRWGSPAASPTRARPPRGSCPAPSRSSSPPTPPSCPRSTTPAGCSCRSRRRRSASWRGATASARPSRCRPARAGSRPWRLSRDGARLALVELDGAESVVWVAAVERDAAGRPIALGEPFAMPRIDGTASDVTWTSATQIAVLAQSADAPQVVQLTVGGDSQQLPQPGAAVRAIVGGSEGTSTLRALAEDGSLLSLRGRVWSPAGGLGPVALVATQQ